ncbi:MAG: type III pantothenate kinase [Clostridiales bacterium]|jgi:type III pantothenate kinase|nr:type III pantothenate kinase [Clostridiales bacterium]
MLLCIDIGNTNITLGAFKNHELVFVSRLATESDKTDDQCAVELNNIFRLYGVSPSNFDGAIICSVVPELNRSAFSAVKKLCGIEPMRLSAGVKTGVNILTDNPAEVGADLVAGAAAAAAEYALPCLVIDLGTATKVSVIDENGAFLGCAIAPGVNISLEALSARTSQLPRISFKAPSGVIGKNTVDSMQSGIIFGTAAMIDGMCDKIETELCREVKTVIATGGLAGDIAGFCRRDIIVNRELILEGLRLIYARNNAQKSSAK